jgi:hypothetical protein
LINPTEKLFLEAYRANGGRLRKSTSKGDIEFHVDFTDPDTGESFDVKEPKAISRGEDRQYDLVLLEWTNVRGDAGWLRGRATTIAFAAVGGFILADREELVELVKAVDWEKPFEGGPKGVTYKRYDRSAFGRKDAFCWVPVQDVIGLPSTKVLDKRP